MTEAIATSPVYWGGRKKLQKLTEEELSAYRADACYEEEHQIMHVRACRICGLCRANLGSISKYRASHLDQEHHFTAREYQDFCQAQGWGRPPTTSPHMLQVSQKKRDKNRPRIQEENRRAEEKRKASRRQEPASWKGYYARRLKVRQEKLRAKLTDAEWAARIACPLCEREGLDYRFLTLQNHVPEFHGVPWGQFLRQFPDVPTIVPEGKIARDTHLAAGRKLQFPHRGGRKPIAVGEEIRKLDLAGLKPKQIIEQLGLIDLLRREIAKDWRVSPDQVPTRVALAKAKEKVKDHRKRTKK